MSKRVTIITAGHYLVEIPVHFCAFTLAHLGGDGIVFVKVLGLSLLNDGITRS